MIANRIIELTEYQPLYLEVDALTPALGERIWREATPYVQVEFPTPQTKHRWKLTAQGWLGYIPIDHEVGLLLQPRASFNNLYRMFELAYQLDDLAREQEIFRCDTVLDFYQSLLVSLCHRVKKRTRTGLYQRYTARHDELQCVRGTVQMVSTPLRRPGSRVQCRFDELSADVTENRILLWSLCRVLRTGLCTPALERSVRILIRELSASVTIAPCGEADYASISYNRLNQDYQFMHVLCRLLNSGEGPSTRSGSALANSFLLNSSVLFERFVAEWLRRHLPDGGLARVQERVHLGGRTHFVIDLMLFEEGGESPAVVIDTKYKRPEGQPSAEDVAQIVAYATAVGCSDAVLLYPEDPVQPVPLRVGSVRVRSLSFALDQALTVSGNRLLQDLWGDRIRWNQAA